MGEYSFRKGEIGDADAIYRLVLQRMRWMDAQGIRQWNCTDYASSYPPEYYREKQRRGELYVLYAADGGIACAAVLLDADDRWDEAAEALYIHNFVSGTGHRGAGAEFLRCAEQLAKAQGKQYLRLDSAEDNAALAAYYERHGFVPAGTCADGPYRGILRQKKLK